MNLPTPIRPPCPPPLRPRRAIADVLAAALAGLLAVAPSVYAADYVQATGSTLAFATAYDGEVFVGRVPRFQTRLTFDPQQLEAARLDVAIPLAGTETGNLERDETLLGRDFFDIANFPQARYTASVFRHLGEHRYAADGTLELRGVARPVTLTFDWTPGARPVLAGRAKVRRLAHGVGGGDWADTELLPDEVAVSTRVIFDPVR